MTREATFDIGHPAPYRGRVSRWRLFAALGTGPAAWSIQLGANTAISGAVCIDDAGARLAAAPVEWAGPALIIINLAALAVTAVALILGVTALRVTKAEHGASGGGVMDAGEGRTRFLATWGVWTCVLFLIAIGFNTASVFWRGMCPV